jgi:hypothetical protein
MLRILLCGLAMTAVSLRAQEKATLLFNGKDLSGWKAVFEDPKAEAAGTWSVHDGILRCTGQPVGYLRTTRDDYHDYVLTLEWRWPEGAKGGNNGVLVHTSTPAALGVWPRSIEVQLFSGDAGDFWVIPESVTIRIPDQANRQKGRRHINLTDGTEKPIGQWNTMEITCKSDTISVKINGTLVNEASHCSETKGAICLQSEGAPTEFRNIQIRSLE